RRHHLRGPAEDGRQPDVPRQIVTPGPDSSADRVARRPPSAHPLARHTSGCHRRARAVRSQLVHEGLDFVLQFTLIISAAVIVLVAITVAIFLYVRRRSRSAD